MSCCSDVMKPIEALSCCTPQDTKIKHKKSNSCGNDGEQDEEFFRVHVGNTPFINVWIL